MNYEIFFPKNLPVDNGLYLWAASSLASSDALALVLAPIVSRRACKPGNRSDMIRSKIGHPNAKRQRRMVLRFLFAVNPVKGKVQAIP
jgi:hypothetical protein